jgi:hypothetical protein
MPTWIATITSHLFHFDHSEIIALDFLFSIKPTMTSNTWNGNAMSQWDMMEKDTVLVLNNNDEILGAASKKTSHVFEPGQPRGIVHRAFSVFLFDASTNELLLQQRASSKITFPNVRTDTRYV